MKKLLKNQIIQEHVLPTLIVLGWFSVLLVLAVILTNS